MKIDTVFPNGVYIHKSTGNSYIVDKLCTMKKDDGSWVDAVIYHTPRNTTQTFVRAKDSFLERFELNGAANDK